MGRWAQPTRVFDLRSCAESATALWWAPIRVQPEGEQSTSVVLACDEDELVHMSGDPCPVLLKHPGVTMPAREPVWDQGVRCTPRWVALLSSVTVERDNIRNAPI